MEELRASQSRLSRQGLSVLNSALQEPSSLPLSNSPARLSHSSASPRLSLLSSPAGRRPITSKDNGTPKEKSPSNVRTGPSLQLEEAALPPSNMDLQRLRTISPSSDHHHLGTPSPSASSGALGTPSPSYEPSTPVLPPSVSTPAPPAHQASTPGRRSPIANEGLKGSFTLSLQPSPSSSSSLIRDGVNDSPASKYRSWAQSQSLGSGGGRSPVRRPPATPPAATPPLPTTPASEERPSAAGPSFFDSAPRRFWPTRGRNGGAAVKRGGAGDPGNGLEGSEAGTGGGVGLGSQGAKLYQRVSSSSNSVKSMVSSLQPAMNNAVRSFGIPRTLLRGEKTAVPFSSAAANLKSKAPLYGGPGPSRHSYAPQNPLQEEEGDGRGSRRTADVLTPPSLSERGSNGWGGPARRSSFMKDLEKTEFWGATGGVGENELLRVSLGKVLLPPEERISSSVDPTAVADPSGLERHRGHFLHRESWKLVDYFFVARVECAIQQPDECPDDLTAIPLRAQVAERYPEEDLDGFPLPTRIQHFCFPQGVYLKPGPEEPTLHNFVCTDEEGRMLHGATLIFYEAATAEEIAKIYGLSTETVASSLPAKTPALYRPVAICATSIFGLFGLLNEILRQLYRLSLSELPMPLERYITHVVTAMPLPPRGIAEVQALIGDHHVTVCRPPPNSFECMDIALRPIFELLDVRNVIYIFSLLLTESRVVFCSRMRSLLVPVAEGFCSFLFPFWWQGLYIPVLPAELYKLLEAPVPFVMGIDAAYLSQHDREDWPEDVYFVDLDNNLVFDPQGQEPISPIDFADFKIPGTSIFKLMKKIESVADVFVPLELRQASPVSPSLSSLSPNPAVEALPVNRVAHPSNSIASQDRLSMNSLGRESWNRPPSALQSWKYMEGDKAFPSVTTVEPITRFPSVHGILYHKSLSARDQRYGTTVQAGGDSGLKRRSFLMHQMELEETEGFSRTAVREAFFCFVLSLLRGYRGFLPAQTSDYREFNVVGFINSKASAGQLDQQLTHRLVETQMFDKFVQERLQYKELAEIEYVDAKLTEVTSGIKTAFLQDASYALTEVFVAPTPSQGRAGANAMHGEAFQYTSFPRLQSSLFGSPHLSEPQTLNLRSNQEYVERLRSGKPSELNRRFFSKQNIQKALETSRRNIHHWFNSSDGH